MGKARKRPRLRVGAGGHARVASTEWVEEVEKIDTRGHGESIKDAQEVKNKHTHTSGDEHHLQAGQLVVLRALNVGLGGREW